MAKGASGGGGDRHPQASIAGVVIIRLFLGGFFLYNAINDLAHPQQFIAFIRQASQAGGIFVKANLWPGFAGFLTETVAPRAEIFGWVLLLAGLLAGLLFLVGFLTRLAALMAMCYTLFFLFATLHPAATVVDDYPLAVNGAFFVMELAVLVAAAGRTWGLDCLLARRTRVKLLW